MSVSRLELILFHLHFVDDNLQVERGSPRFDKLFKIRPLLGYLDYSFRTGARMESQLFIDKMLAPAKGRIPSRVFMPNKPHKRGIKLWSLAGAKSGYVHKYQIFGDYTLEDEEVHHSIGNSGLVVLELASGLEPGTLIYFNNYFASPLLAKKLKEEKGINSTMTLRGGRKAGAQHFMATEKIMSKKPRGNLDFVSANGVLVCQWFDKKLVTAASTECKARIRSYCTKCKVYLCIQYGPCFVKWHTQSRYRV